MGKKLKLLPGKEIEFETKFTNFEDCATAFAHSRRSSVSVAMMDKKNRIVSRSSKVSSFVDSREMHYWLQHYQPLGEELRSHPGLDVIPVYIFDLLHPNTGVFEQYKSHLAMSDMVLAIATPLGKYAVGAHCGNSPMHIDTKKNARAIMAGLLETVFGVIPTHVQYRN